MELSKTREKSLDTRVYAWCGIIRFVRLGHNIKNLVPRIQNSRFLLTSDNITTPLYALCVIIRIVRLGHNIKNPKFDQNPLRIE